MRADRSDPRGMLYIAIGLTVALLAGDLLDLTARRTERKRTSSGTLP